MNITKKYIKEHYINDLEQIKTNLIKINHQISNSDHNFFEDLIDEIFYLSTLLYINRSEYYIIELEEELKNEIPKISDAIEDIEILKKLNKKQ